jgi:predicted enzyme related to lactoylglutathione lyase
MAAMIHNFAFDSADPYELAQFWSKVTGRPVDAEDQPGGKGAAIDLGNGTNLYFQQSPEPKTAKNRTHVCLQADTTRDDEVERLLGIGATFFADYRRPDGTGWVVLQDPEGNEFCVERSVAEREASGS